jgi:hypothetical protein
MVTWQLCQMNATSFVSSVMYYQPRCSISYMVANLPVHTIFTQRVLIEGQCLVPPFAFI